jgi:hypothetical protein
MAAMCLPNCNSSHVDQIIVYLSPPLSCSGRGIGDEEALERERRQRWSIDCRPFTLKREWRVCVGTGGRGDWQRVGERQLEERIGWSAVRVFGSIRERIVQRSGRVLNTRSSGGFGGSPESSFVGQKNPIILLGFGYDKALKPRLIHSNHNGRTRSFVRGNNGD